MKKMCYYALLINIFIISIAINCFSENIGDNQGGQTIYQGMESSKTSRLTGVDLTKFGYKTIEKVLNTSDSIYIVLGVTPSNACEIALIFPETNQKRVIAAYPEKIISSVKKEITFFTMNKFKHSKFVLFEYDYGNVNALDLFMDLKGNNLKFEKTLKLPSKYKMFISDANQDGYPDILVWEPNKSNSLKQNNSGTMSVISFDPEKKSFTDLKSLKVVENF